MGKTTPIFIINDTFNFPKGKVIREYTQIRGGVVSNASEFISSKDYIYLTEKLSSDDEKRVREIIKQQLRILLWNLYTKQSVIVPQQ